MGKDNLSSLYNALISKGYSTDDLGDENTFRSKMSDKNNRKDLYDYVSGRGDFRIGDYDSYENRLAGDMEGNTSKVGPKVQGVVDEFDSFRRANAQNEEGNREQPIQRPTLKDMVNPQNEPLWMKRGNAVPSKDGLLSNEDLENRLEIAFKSGALEPLRHRDEDASIDKEYTPKTEEKEEDVFENYRNRFGLTQRGTELQEELAQIQGDLHNKYSQEFENTPEYKAIVGKKYNTKEEIDAANKALNDAYNKKYGAVINKEMEPYLKAYESEIFQRYAPRIQEGLRTVAKNDTSKEVKKLTVEVDDLLEKQHKILRSKGPSSGNAMNALMGSTAYNQSMAKERQELGALEASQRLLEQSQEIIEEAGKKGNTNFFAGLGRGFRDNMDIENFTFGLSEMADSKYLNRALEKAEKGEKLTPAEEKLLEASVVNMATYGYFSSDLGRGYGAGSTTAVSLPFMLEFIANPISGSGNAIAKGLLKFGLKKFGRASAQTAGKGALNAFGRGITSNAGKFAGRLVGDATAALGMEGTTGLGRVAAGTLDRLNENYDYLLDDNGKLQVQKTGDTSIVGAFARSAASKFFENQSEMVFNAFRGWSPFMKAVDRALPGRVGEFMNRIKNSKPGQLYRELKNNPTFKEIVERAQFHGQGEEYLEEVYNNLANVAMGEMTMEDALDLDNNIDTFLGLAPTSVMFGLLGLGSMAADRYSNRRKKRTAFGKMTPEQQAKLTELTQMSKERGNEDIKNFIEATIADTDLTPEQKRDEIEYAFELAKQNAIEDLQQEQTSEERAADDAYIQGAEMPVEQRYSANQERIAAEESLREVDEKALDTIDRLLADDASMNEVNEVLSGMEEQTAMLARDYYNKSVRMNGVVDSARDDAQETGDVFEANLEKAVVTDELGNRTVTTATLMSTIGEEKAQVKVIDNDGTKAIILMDDGSKKMVSSNSLSNVQTMPADDIVNAYKEKIETQAKEQTAFTIQNHPKTQIPQPGMQLWNGDIPFIITEVNADGSVRAFPAVLDSNTGQMELKNGSTPIDMSVKESLDLQNDYYNKMDAAVNGVNLSEKQAQNAISPSDGKSKVLAEVATQPITGKTEESGRYSTESVQPSQDVEQTSPIVMKEDGTPDFVATGKVNSLSYLNDKYKEKTLRKIEVTKAAYAKDLEKASVALEKAQITFDDAPIGREAKAEEALQKAKQAYDNVKRESDFWTSLYEIAKIDAEQPGDKIEEEIRAMGEPMDGRELAAEMLASGRLPLLYSDYKRETGFGENEAKGLFGLFKSKDNGGLSIKKAGEILMLADQEAGSNFFDSEDANAGRNAILDVLSSVRTRGGLIDYVKNNREAMAERERAAEQEYEEEQREAWAQENFGMSYADYITYEEVINDIIQEKALSKEAIKEFYNNFAEELNNWNNGRITEETTINERRSVDSGSESSEGLLSTEQLSDNRGIETDISAEVDGRADNKGAPASEESIITEIKDAREQVDTNPSDAQKEAGNYKKGHIKLDGYDITIENPKGSERSGTDGDGNLWSIIMNNDYGYIRGTESMDGDHIDVFLSDNPVDGKVYVIDQINEDGSFDEHKVMYGFNSTDEARDAYLSNYSPGWNGLGTISEVSKDEFKKWIDSSQRKTKPFVEYKNVKRESTQGENQGNITSKSTSPQKNRGEVAENLPQSKSTAKNKNRTADIKRARYELMDAKRELSVAQSTNSGYTPEEVEEKKKRVEEAENELKKLTNTKNAFLGESDFILKRVDEAFKKRKDKSMSKEEWGYTDEALTAENEASDSYSSYIKDLANSGELQKMYDNSSVGERIQIREGIETAGLEVNDLIDTSKGKEEAKKKRDAKKKKQSEELMKKLGIYDKGVRYRFMGEQGAANLDKAEEATTRMDNLDVARDMEAAFNAKKERIEKIRDSKPVEITGEEYKGKYELNRDSAQKYILDNLRGEYTIDDTGEKVKISKKGAKKVTSHSQGNEAHMKSIVAIPELIRNSIFIEEQPAYKEKAQYDSYRYYVVGLKIGEEDYTVRITIGVKNGEFYYDHYLTEIEKGNLIEVAQSFKPTEDAPNPSYAKNKDSILLSILQTNDKENAKKIKMATGWERGADGKWRYEVEDFEVDSEGLARKNRLWSNLSWGKEYDLLSDKLFDGIELTEEESSRFDELAGKANDLRKSYQANDKRYLDDYVKDDRLFKAYPELKQIRVELYNAPTSNTGANYYESQNLIRVNESALNHEDFRSILAHEVQHAVQAIEGFARGGNRMTYRRYLDALKEKRDAWSMLEEFDRKREELGKDASQIDVYNALRDEYLSDGFNFGDGFIPSRTAFDNGFNLWVRGYDKEGYKDSYDEYQHLINKFGLGFDNDRYKELSGEVESRNVQSRMNMTPEERRNTLASETEDVSREDQIFLNDAFSSTSLSALLMKEDTNQEQIIQSVEDLSGKLNTPVRIARTLDEIPDGSAKRAIGEGREVKAWFDTGTRKVFLYLPNADSVDDAIASVLHEVVGHRGLRNLFGTENEMEFDSIMMDLFEKLPLDVRSEIADMAVSRYASNVSIAMDEYLAEQSEKDETPGWWDRVVSAIRDFFRKMGVDVQLSENDVKYLLWRSRKKLESGYLFEYARDVVMRNKLGIDSDETQKVSESVPKEGTRFRIIGGIFDSAGKDVEVVERETGNAREMYDRTLQTAGYKMRESWQDSMLGLKEAQDAIAKATHSRILDYENAYMAENALSSRSLAEINAYRELVYKPILEEIAQMKKQGAKYENISDYLITKHGIERNREMAVRKALAEDEDTVKENIERWTEGKKNIWNNDSMSWREKQEELDRIAASYGADMSVDYSGLSAMFPNDDMEETTAEAYKAVEDFEGKFETTPLLDKVKAATTATLDKQRDSGLMNKDTYKSIQDMYQFYVPLRGWEEKTADEVYDYITSETPVFNAPLKTAKGRRSKSDDPLPTIANIAESGILQGNRNLMKQKFLTMVENHPSNLVSVSELWVKYDAVNDKWTAIFPEIPNNASAEEVENIVSQFNARMEELSKNNPDEYKKASDARDIPYKILPNNLKEHQVIVKRNGKEYVLTINGNPRAAQALNGVTNPNATDNPVIKAFEATNRFLAANFTQRNPAFVISNMFRDGFYSNSVIWVKESPLYAKKYNKNWAKSLKEMGGLVKRYKTNSLDMNNDTDRMFLEFINNGGETGYTFINSVEEYKGIIAKELKKQNRSKLAPGKAFDILGEAMDTFGRWAEDTSRFAAYRTSREMGRSVARSISDAKEISVNFNKKGSGAKTAGKWEKGNRLNAFQAWTSQIARGLYIFWNAGVQGLTNFARLAKRNPGKFAGLASSYFVLGTMMPIINATIASVMGGDGDEDNYYNLPEYVRRNNICIYVGGEWVTIPLPIELRAIYGLGELTSGLLSGKENMTGMRLTKKIAEQVSQIMPIDMMEGGGGFSAFVPSYVKPVYEVWTNKDWTGIPIYRKNDFNKNMPGWTKAYSSTSPELVKLSEIINEWTGGNKYKTGMIDFNPAIVEHLFESYLGGVGTTINQLKKTLMMPFDEDLQELRNAPVLSRFMRSADSRSVQKRIDEEYFNNRDRFELIRQEVNGYKKELENPQTNDFDYAKYQTLYNKMINSDEYRKYIEFKEMDKVLNKMRDAFKQNGNEELEAQMFLLKEAMNEVSK